MPSIKCYYFNARSLNNKISEFTYFLENSKYDIILITETWFKNYTPDGLICCKNYNVYRFDRKIGKGGGVICLVKNTFSSNKSDVFFDDSNEIICVDVKIVDKLYRFCCIYVPPILGNDIKVKIFENFAKICNNNVPVFVFGDFNEPNIDWLNPDPSKNILIDYSFRNGLEQLVLNATRGFNVLDLVFTTHKNLVLSVDILPPFSNSDHSSIEVEIVIKNSINSVKPTRNFSKADYFSINSYLSQINWYEFFRECHTTNDFWLVYKNTLHELIDKFVPIYHEPKQKIDFCLKNLIRLKHKLWKKMKINHSITNKSVYNKCLRDIKTHCVNRKISFETNLLQKDRINFYKYAKQTLGTNTSIPPIKWNNDLITDNIYKTEKFNKYFQSVFTHDIENTRLENVIVQDKFSNITFTEYDILLAIKQLKNSSSYGPDNIPPIFLKNIADFICVPLCIIFNRSFRTHTLPLDWLISKVIPVHKKGNKNEVENYRPISLTCISCKIMETIIKQHLTKYLEDNKILSASQYGFRAEKSTSLQLLQCMNSWTKNFDNQVSTDVIYFDFTKAFDKVSHQKLFQKLESIGISGNLLLWLIAFLSDRRQCVCINNVLSNFLPVFSGVPQGSVLGPLLFLIFINDLPLVLPRSISCFIFADDLKIFSSINSVADVINLQCAISLIHDWSNKWNLPISVMKTFVLHLGKNNPCYSYSLNNVILQKSNSCRDLGINISHDLKFSKHINEIVKNAYFKTWQIYYIFQSKNAKLLTQAFVTYVRPILEFSSIVWSPYLLKDIKLIEKVQKRFTKKICSKNLTYFERLKFLNLKSLEERRLQIDLIETFKFLHQIHSISLENCFEKRTNLYKPNDLYIDFSRTEIRKYWFANRVCKIWNNLPNEIKSAKNLSTFKNKLNSFDLSVFCRGLIPMAT